MDSTENKKRKSPFRLLIVLSILTLVAWNTEIFLTFVSFLLPNFDLNAGFGTGSSISFLIWAGMSYAMPILPVFTIIFSAVKLKAIKNTDDKSRVLRRNWFIAIITLNAAFCVMFAGFQAVRIINPNNALYPDLSVIYRTVEGAALKGRASDEVILNLENMNANYDDEFSFSIYSSENNSAQLFSRYRNINFTIYESNFDFFFHIGYDTNYKIVTRSNFENNFLRQKVNLRMIELLSEIIGEDPIIHIRWDSLSSLWSQHRSESVPVDANADDILAGEYGRLRFNPLIFVLTDDIMLYRAKEMSAIMKNIGDVIR